MASYLCGIDIGGTFTDCVLIDEAGQAVTAKAPSTPRDFGAGLIAAMGVAAAKLGIGLDELCRSIALLAHGTTVGTNTVIQKRGAKIGLITTRGHEDVIHIMRGSRGLSGRDVRLVVHFPESRKPDPIVPKSLIRGVSERVDCFGNVVVALNEAEAAAAIEGLLAAGVEALAICFLWSFKAPAHECRVKEMVEARAPGLFVTCSHELVPKWGEYERTTAVALNAYIGPATTSYLARVERDLAALGYREPLQIAQCAGGTISVRKAIEAPLLTLDSGPVAGIAGSRHVGALMGYRNIITTDMGGTSFDVGVIHDGEPVFSHRSLVNQYEYFLPKVDIQTIGSGGGSKVWIDPVTRALKVGPESAGAEPGPACYGRGGTAATVTDADLLVGYLDPDTFAGGTLRLDRAKAEAAVAAVAVEIGMSVPDCARGIGTIAEFQMADLIRKVTVQKGLDPRDFVLFAFGGAGPVHAGVFARELGIAEVIVPQRETAATWCAFGAASADILHLFEHVDIQSEPFDIARINARLADLRARASQSLAEDGIVTERQRFQFALDMRHRGQINEVEVPIAGDALSAGSVAPLRRHFYEVYERLYGRGASFAGARLEIVTLRCRAGAATPKPLLVASERLEAEVLSEAHRPSRPVLWPGATQPRASAIYDGARLRAGNRLSGPAIVETATTTVVVHAGQRLLVDAFGNFELAIAPRVAPGDR
ncbi:MAG: hydantoinase/oxoprolinase family protein [Alphaproteobacteria bacterium]|nr:hydantoinase/oxoprolinase family protein [Alphaproteobacteria bacterium]